MTDKALVICPCVAENLGLAASGPRSLIGCILPIRNDPWLNAAPVTWAEFAGDNGDIKFPLRVPILPETHEIHLYDVQRCCRRKNELDLAYEVQVGQAVTAGYFGGYSAKMQDIGKRELLGLEQGVVRKAAVSTEKSEHAMYMDYARRLVRDLEGKGIVRTAVETTNLAVHSAEHDILSAECIRTFPSVSFPATLLLRREEVETEKVPGHSIITALASGGGKRRKRAYQEPPFDLMYGFRGTGAGQELYSPYEMIREWTMEKVLPPTSDSAPCRSRFTAAGLRHREECKAAKQAPEYEAGEHYECIAADGRILIPDLPELHNLRHRWVWERRPRPHVPVWSFAKVPKTNISPEENARMLCVYMRPWTLHAKYVSTDVPLLSQMRRVSPQKLSGDVTESAPADSASANRDAVEAGVWR